MNTGVTTFKVTGSVLVGNAALVSKDGLAAIAGGVTEIDFSHVTEVDSSGIAVLLSWLREIKASGRDVSIKNIPPGMRKLADVYGVGEFLP